ncbi:hypothetical protein [Thermus filiformis]|uniref:hypothetical protein n=1 Tax=Thermus filiformis TaxID=276 RepID=UPI0005319676|nr:hypothetical protein [Thermus filiformis]
MPKNLAALESFNWVRWAWLFLLSFALASPEEVARGFVARWLAGEVSPSLREVLASPPEDLPQALDRLFAYPPPPRGLRVNLEAPLVEGDRVRFPATLGEEGGEVVVYLRGEEVERVAFVRKDLLPAFAKSEAGGLFLLLLGVYWASALWGRGALARLFREALALLRQERRLYLGLNLLLYGLFALGSLLAFLEPGLARAVQKGIGGALEVIGLEEALGGFLPLLAAIYYWNLTQGLVLTTLLPGLFLGLPALLLNASRYLLFGFALSPALLPLHLYLLHLPTLVLELQAYILGTFGGVLLLLSLLRREGFRVGLGRLLRMGYLGAFVLLLAALYEAVEVVFLLGGRG